MFSLSKETLFDVFRELILMIVQVIPLWLLNCCHSKYFTFIEIPSVYLCYNAVLKLYHNLSKEIVSSKPVKIPNSDLEVSVVEFGTSYRRVNKCLVPSWVVCVVYSLGSPLGFLAPI